jgi:hypothetical protein
LQVAGLLADVDAARTDFGVDHAIAGIVNGIGGGAVSNAVISITGKAVMMVVTMMMMAEVASTEVMSTAAVMPTAVKATAATAVATGRRGSDESCGRRERDKDENEFTKHFNLHVWCLAPFQWCDVMVADTGGDVREVT